jgi:hypothetical protein
MLASTGNMTRCRWFASARWEVSSHAWWLFSTASSTMPQSTASRAFGPGQQMWLAERHRDLHRMSGRGQHKAETMRNPHPSSAPGGASSAGAIFSPGTRNGLLSAWGGLSTGNEMHSSASS